MVGCGYLGHRVARRWRDQGTEVWVTTRRNSRAAQLRAEGFRALIADVMDGDSLRSWPAVDTVLYAVGYDRGSQWSQQQVYVEGLCNVLAALPTPVDRFLYISSTGVYGQADGEWVDEQSRCEPMRPGGKACLDAETCAASARDRRPWRDFADGRPVRAGTRPLLTRSRGG